MARRITKGKIQFISLCEAGANQIPVMYKSADAFSFQSIVKADIEKGELTAVVYAPELRDSQGDIADAEVIRDMAHGFLKDGKGIDITHNGVALSKDAAFVAESFIIQKGDPRFAGIKTSKGDGFDPTGAWGVVLKINDPNLRQLYRDGLWAGVSMGGSGTVAVGKADGTKTQRMLRRITDHLGISQPRVYHSTTISGEIQMNRDELMKILDDRDTTLLTKIKETVGSAISVQADASLAKAAGVLDADSAEVRSAKITLHKDKLAKGTVTAPAAVTAPAEEVAPIFKGDLSDAKAVAQFEYDVQVFNIKKSMDASSPASVRKAQEEIAKLTKPGAAEAEAKVTNEDAAANIEKTDSEEVKMLKRRLHFAKKSSNQSVVTQTNAGAPSIVGLTKEQQDGVSAGMRMQEYIAKTQPGLVKKAG